MNTKHLLFAYSLPFTNQDVKTQFAKQTGGASITPGHVSIITDHMFTPMFNMHCCC